MNQTVSIQESQQHDPGVAPQADRTKLREVVGEAMAWNIVYRPSGHGDYSVRVKTAREDLKLVEHRLAEVTPALATSESYPAGSREAALREIQQSRRMLRGVIIDMAGGREAAALLPRVVLSEADEEPREKPRLAEVAALYLRAVDGRFSGSSLIDFINEMQTHEPLTVAEIWSLPVFLKAALLESLLADAKGLLNSPRYTPATSVQARVGSLSAIGRCVWPKLLEPLITFDATLRQDPADAFARMDFDSRQQYRSRIAYAARHSDNSETQVAQEALELAREASSRNIEDGRTHYRRSHVGYYLLNAGFTELAARIGFHPPLMERVRSFLRANADDFYITGIQFLTIVLTAIVIMPLIPGDSHLLSLAITCAWFLVPISQLAVEFVNTAITTIFTAEPLPKLDFSEGIPNDCTTLVTVPSLLLHEAQVRELIADLEIRYLANRDPHLHFVLLTDLADSVTKPHENDSHPLVDLAVRLVEELNARYAEDYASGKGGGFLLLHRHRIFNRRQAAWMGWERKRGKLLDLNKLLCGEFDAFPLKAGRLEALRQVRYVLTLDSDTQLPRDAAARLIGAMAHPLNQAVIDPKLRIVTAGYGILQPRVGVTVHSASRSRLAAIYSGQSGLDTYTRAVSDAYQDLYGEGIFTGKGIYEVATLHAVLDRRFPRDVLLSHDLIEGAYARAGLATDIEIIDDYPSHYSAYTRRKHRWVRGDWQIAQWMFSRVPEEGNRSARNPISNISRWKIFDNLRRSLVDPLTCILLVAGWAGLPGGPLYWTLVTLLLLICPALLQLAFGLTRSLLNEEKGHVPELLYQCTQTLLIALLSLVFLPHQMLLSLDAIVRSLVRQFITGERLLEWETAAQAESRSVARTPVDRYLTLMPLVTLALALFVYFAARDRQAIFIAAPILSLWAIAGAVPAWLNRPPREQSQRVEAGDRNFLLLHALRIWRFFAEFNTDANHHLIPDNVREDGLREAQRVSPTNAGFLLNARQAACELGFLTIPEFAQLTEQSLDTLGRLEKHRGHLYNWYDTQSLEVLAPMSLSSVDSGNFVASLYTLHTGARELAGQPLLTEHHRTGLKAAWQLMTPETRPWPTFGKLSPPSSNAPWSAWIEWLIAVESAFEGANEEPSEARSESSVESGWSSVTKRRVSALLEVIRRYLPWMLPEYAALRLQPALGLEMFSEVPRLTDAAMFAEGLCARLADFAGRPDTDVESRQLSERLQLSTLEACGALHALVDGLDRIAVQAKQLADDADFSVFVDQSRTLLSIGYDPQSQQMHDSCYDLLASEARIATFLAVARDQLPQRGWFNLGRSHTHALGQSVLLSWTGTMFEYLMPSLWMRSYQDTLIGRTLAACVRAQQMFGRSLQIPWGISESGFAQQDEFGNYQYHAFGIPALALKFDANAGPVVSPYSSFLALGVDAPEALRNLRRMAELKWVGTYGYYEAADFSAGDTGSAAVVREWMAHHQGMALLAITNLLGGNVFQRWFHANALVQASELLLHERPIHQAMLKASLEEFAPI